ncbi:hypothetical protein LXL04_006031 [Taraxacum kok-saghyz]
MIKNSIVFFCQLDFLSPAFPPSPPSFFKKKRDPEIPLATSFCPFVVLKLLRHLLPVCLDSKSTKTSLFPSSVSFPSYSPEDTADDLLDFRILLKKQIIGGLLESEWKYVCEQWKHIQEEWKTKYH